MAEGGRDAVLFLERDRFYFYDGANITSLVFPENIVHDLEVKDREALYNTVILFIQNNKIIPSHIYFVLSEAVCFSKEFPVTDPKSNEKIDTDIQTFLGSVPFNAIVYKVYKTPVLVKVVAANQEMTEILLDAFQTKGFGLRALVPVSIYPEFITKRDLTPDLIKHVVDNQAKALEANMVGWSAGKEEAPEGPKKIISKGKLPYLIGVFVLLIIVLIVVFLLQPKSTPKKQKVGIDNSFHNVVELTNA